MAPGTPQRHHFDANVHKDTAAMIAATSISTTNLRGEGNTGQTGRLSRNNSLLYTWQVSWGVLVSQDPDPQPRDPDLDFHLIFI